MSQWHAARHSGHEGWADGSRCECRSDAEPALTSGNTDCAALPSHCQEKVMAHMPVGAAALHELTQ